MTYDAVIFDKDGVLIDSMKDDFVWADQLRAEILEKEGISVGPEDVKQIVVAQKPSDLDDFLATHDLNWETIQHLENRVADRKIKRLKNGEIGLHDSAREVLEKVKLPKAMVSNSPLRAAEFVVDYYSLEKHFEEVLSPSTDDMKDFIRKKKPNPEMVEEAIASMGASNPLMVGDTADDIEVARNAGIDCCLVNPYKPYVNHDPEYRFDSLKGVLEIPGLT